MLADGEDEKAVDASRARGFLLRDHSILSEFVFREYIRDFAAESQCTDEQLFTLLFETFGFRTEDQADVQAVFYRQREHDAAFDDGARSPSVCYSVSQFPPKIFQISVYRVMYGVPNAMTTHR